MIGNANIINSIRRPRKANREDNSKEDRNTL